MATDKPPFWSMPEGDPFIQAGWGMTQVSSRVLCCGGCYNPMHATYAQGDVRLAICNRPNCDQGDTIWQIPKDEGTP